MSSPETVTLKIDGKTVTVPKGTNVLEAAKTAGIDISYFCYHPGLSSPAVCRQCLVEVKGGPKPVPSCYTPVAPDMEVSTASPRVLEVRQQMLEFTLVNHPVDCPICDKAGECDLQRQYHDWDAKETRVDYDKQHKPKAVDLGPTIVLDTERCILCTRCIRVCDEVAHDHQLEMAHRGDRETITVAPGKQLDNPYSLNTVDVCPVGALTSKDFRFHMRAWELYATDSICHGCATGCNIEVHHSQGQIYRLIPRENQEVNKFWMCDDGRLTYKPIRQDRLAGARLAGAPTSLDKAVAELATKINGLKTATGSLALMGVALSAQASNEDNYALAKLAHALGVERVYVVGHAPQPDRADDVLRAADVNPNSAGAHAVATAVFGGNAGDAAKAKDEVALAADIGAGHVKALWLLDGAPGLSDSGLDGLDLVVLQSSHAGPLGAKASIALPAAAWAEAHATFTNGKGRVQRARAAVEPPGEARPGYELVALVAKRLNVAGFEWASARALFHEMKQAVPAFAGAEFGRDLPTLQLRFANSRG